MREIMREILFRGKRIDNGEWVYGDLIRNDDLQFPMVLIGRLVLSRKYTGKPSFDGYELYEIIPETVGQYTGLTDKNGMKIFEDDIVMLDGDIKQTFDVEDGVILYGRGGFHVKEFGLLNSLNAIASADWVLRGEVIGNIHEDGE